MRACGAYSTGINNPSTEVIKYISGVILFDETFYQKSADGIAFPDLLVSQGIVPGIKVDKVSTSLLNAWIF